MSDESHVTRRELELREKNIILEVTNNISLMFDEKFDKFQERFDVANITRRDQAVLELTGFPYDKREKVVIAVQHAYKEAMKEADTKDKLKTALVNYGVPVTLAAGISWVVSSWDKIGG